MPSSSHTDSSCKRQSGKQLHKKQGYITVKLDTVSTYLYNLRICYQAVSPKLCHCHSTSLLTGVSNVTSLSYLMVTRHIADSQREHWLCCPDDLPLSLQTAVHDAHWLFLSMQGWWQNFVAIIKLSSPQSCFQ